MDSGGKRPVQVWRERGLTEGLRLRWRHEDEAWGEAAFAPRQATGMVALEQRIAELERWCGQPVLENAPLKQGLSRRASGNGTR